jgi:steroid 5-alpha reductase family enzyme
VSPWALVGIGAGVALGGMAVLWVVEERIKDASHVDVAWAYGIGVLAVIDAFLGEGSLCHRAFAGALGGIWSARLGTYLVFDRIIGKPEDGRYQTLRARWGERATRRFFVFFQAQGLLVLTFSVPFLLATTNPSGPIESLEIAGACLVLVGISLGTLADVQLARWRTNPANKGKTCRAGLWRYSRHPNYFFEWLNWVGFATMAEAAPWGWLAWGVPALLLFLLFRITGIPATEEQALKSRGEDYRRYQRETSVFVPWFPRGKPGFPREPPR